MKHTPKPVTKTMQRKARRLSRSYRKAVAWKIRHRCPFDRTSRFDSFRLAATTLSGWKKQGLCRRCTVKAVRP